MDKLELPKIDIDKIGKKGKEIGGKTTAYFRAHWLDYVLLFFICFILGAFDIFILERSDNFLNGEYWAHAGGRLLAYILAGILGVRVGYPRYKDGCEDLKIAFEKNRRLILYKEIDGVRFSEFIGDINKQVKKAAWKSKIRKKLKKLDKKSPDFFPLYYADKNQEHFARFKPKGRFRLIKTIIYNRVKNKADKYCVKRQNLEKLTTDEYIDKNIHVLSVKYYHVHEHDFERIEATETGYKFYKTGTNVKASTAKLVGNSVLFTVICILVMGTIKLNIDEALLEERVIGIFTIIINSIIDIGFTIWRFLQGYFGSEKIVRQEDLRAVLDQNELLIEYKKTLPAELIKEVEI